MAFGGIEKCLQSALGLAHEETDNCLLSVLGFVHGEIKNNMQCAPGLAHGKIEKCLQCVLGLAPYMYKLLVVTPALLVWEWLALSLFWPVSAPCS